MGGWLCIIALQSMSGLDLALGLGLWFRIRVRVISNFHKMKGKLHFRYKSKNRDASIKFWIWAFARICFPKETNGLTYEVKYKSARLDKITGIISKAINYLIYLGSATVSKGYFYMRRLMHGILMDRSFFLQWLDKMLDTMCADCYLPCRELFPSYSTPLSTVSSNNTRNSASNGDEPGCLVLNSRITS